MRAVLYACRLFFTVFHTRTRWEFIDIKRKHGIRSQTGKTVFEDWVGQDSVNISKGYDVAESEVKGDGGNAETPRSHHHG